ncbi:MAG: T9SS type A sorting domain-containing protein [Bacteroidota bacterium]
MKKHYSVILAIVFGLLFTNAPAATHNVSITSNSFSSISNVIVGDNIVWTLVDGFHTTTSTAVPSGAASWDSGQMSTSGKNTHNYTITVAGVYDYECSNHSGMSAQFVVSSVGITEPITNLITNVYPNPFNDKVIIKYDGIESIEMFNVMGEKVKSLELETAQNKTEIDFAGLPAGIYFYRHLQRRNYC